MLIVGFVVEFAPELDRGFVGGSKHAPVRDSYSKPDRR